ncbi:MAG TPA: alkaline phosphatase family protein [Steroidobacteraceae bacterium]|nr:alkaline phosphatase family protein [Steroidobacteraceae bacterium]
MLGRGAQGSLVLALALAPLPPAAAAGPLESIRHFVVIYEENHSFDNLYGGWEGVRGLADASPERARQVDQHAVPYKCLAQADVNLRAPPLPVTCVDTTTAIPLQSAFANAPFTIDAYIAAGDRTCPPPGERFGQGVPNGAGLAGGCTRDIVHRFYQEQYQLDGGRQDRYVTGSDAVGLAMGHYETRRLPIYRYLHARGHPRYAIADETFQGAFGGSFLNHQWLVAAATPVFAGAVQDGGPEDLHSIVDANGFPAAYPLYRPEPAGTVVRDAPLTVRCGPGQPRSGRCGDYAINTIQPFVQPFEPGTPDFKRLPPLTNPTIADRLNAARIDWAWYSGGWSNASGAVGAPGWTNGTGGRCADPRTMAGATYPNCPDALFQFPHQPLSYFAAFDPRTPDGAANRAQHLRDEVEFIALVKRSLRACRLKSVSFVKPVGEENEHPGYASEPRGSNHLVALLRAISRSACPKDTMVIVTYDEFGGQWDHLPPPGQGNEQGPHDEWGPGTRVPTLILAPALRAPFVVDTASHDTTAIAATLEHRFGLEPLGPRDAAVLDYSSVFDASPARASPLRAGER